MGNALPIIDAISTPTAPMPPAMPRQTDHLMRMSQAETNRGLMRSITIGEGNGRCVLYPVPITPDNASGNDNIGEAYVVLTASGPRQLNLTDYRRKPLDVGQQVHQEMRAKFLALIKQAESTGKLPLEARQNAYIERKGAKGELYMDIVFPGNLIFAGKKLRGGQYEYSRVTELGNPSLLQRAENLNRKR